MKEIERQWIMKVLEPEKFKTLLQDSTRIEQYYLEISKETEIRARVIQSGINANYFLTVKRGTGLTREEQECLVPAYIYDAFEKHRIGIKIDKLRIKKDEIVIDKYIAPSLRENYVIVEKEFDSNKTAYTFDINLLHLDGILGHVREITEDERFKCKNVARNRAFPPF